MAHQGGDQLAHDAAIEACFATVVGVFPDMDPTYARQLSSEYPEHPALAIDSIIDGLDNKRPYPKRQMICFKRKRDQMTEEADPRMTELKRKYSDVKARAKAQSEEDITVVELVLRRHFKFLPANIISQTMAGRNNLLLPTYLDLEEKLRLWDTYTEKPWPGLGQHVATQSDQFLTALSGDTSFIRPTAYDARGVFDGAMFTELLSAIRIRNSRIRAVEEEKSKKAEQERLDQEAVANGIIGECGCCFVDYPLSRMVHCDGENEHMFCPECCRRNAESQIGLSRWELQCMSTEVCAGGFSHAERAKFLDPKLTQALDRLEGDSAVNLAGLDLTACPFCPFAAEYPPVKEDREFQCKNEACMKISCRLCRKETHVPKTCEEALKDSGSSARLMIEEAMSKAMIRLCNKCKTPFIKDAGCNKMTCTVPACRNVQCYICSKNCDYKHFARKYLPEDGCCPLYDNSEDRHEKEVRKAQEEITKRVQSERPDILPGSLEITVSDTVRQDEERRRLFVEPVDPRFNRGFQLEEMAREMRERGGDHGEEMRDPAEEIEALFDRHMAVPPFDVLPELGRLPARLQEYIAGDPVFVGAHGAPRNPPRVTPHDHFEVPQQGQQGRANNPAQAATPAAPNRRNTTVRPLHQEPRPPRDFNNANRTNRAPTAIAEPPYIDPHGVLDGYALARPQATRRLLGRQSVLPIGHQSLQIQNYHEYAMPTGRLRTRGDHARVAECTQLRYQPLVLGPRGPEQPGANNGAERSSNINITRPANHGTNPEPRRHVRTGRREALSNHRNAVLASMVGGGPVTAAQANGAFLPQQAHQLTQSRRSE